MGFKPYSLIARFFLKKNLKIKDYSKLDKETKEFIDYTIKNSLRPNPNLRKGFKKLKPKKNSFWQLKWIDLIMLREHLGEKDVLQALKLIYGIKDKDFLKMNLLNVMAVYRWMAQQVKDISEIEKQELGEEPTQKEKNAGIEKLEPFGYSVTLRALKKVDPFKDWLNEPYAVVFKELCLNKVLREIQEEMHKK